MESTNIISNLEKPFPIRYKIETSWGLISERSFKLTILRLPGYEPKISTNEVIDIGDNHLVGFMNKLAIGLGTARLALPAISSEDRRITLHFNSDFLLDFTAEELLTLQTKIASTLDFLNQKLSLNPHFLATIQIANDQ